MNNEKNIVNGIADIVNLGLCDVALEKAMSRTNRLPGIVCMYGPSGYGKSIAAMYVANRRRAYYVQAKSVWTKKSALKAILHEMGIRPLPLINDMLDQAAEELAKSGRPLIMDEMDYLVEKNAVNLIHDLYEASQSPILIIGEERLPDKLKKHEKIHGRVLAWVPAQPITLEDAKKLTPLYAPHVEITGDLLSHIVQLSAGSVRRVAVNMEMIQEEANEMGWSVIDKSTWGKRELYTGEAPKRRI
jgi:DNA transposition AAA+ family ATPase